VKKRIYLSVNAEGQESLGEGIFVEGRRDFVGSKYGKPRSKTPRWQ
jgi:hypothetical protein